MFTLWLNNETRNVTGLITPCHRPSQNPAMCGASTVATLFGPAAQAARTSAITTSTTTCLALDVVTPITSASSEGALAGNGLTQRSPVDGTTGRPRERHARCVRQAGPRVCAAGRCFFPDLGDISESEERGAAD